MVELAAGLRRMRAITGFLEALVRTRRYDDEWTIDRWRLEPRIRGLQFDEPNASEQAPPLWKDLTIASIAAALLWAAAAMLFS
jgi:hypothetical protein